MGISRKTREEILQEISDAQAHSEYPDYVSEMYGGFYTMIPDDEEEE